jgi:hypothetical protein
MVESAAGLLAGGIPLLGSVLLVSPMMKVKSCSNHAQPRWRASAAK